MNKKSIGKKTAVIEICSNNIQMRVFQLVKGQIQVLDHLEYPIALGHDVFEDGVISFENLREMSEILKKFTQALLAYGIQTPKVVSCAPLRGAKNSAFVLDQIKVRNNLVIEILEENEEKALLYWEVLRKLGAQLQKDSYSLLAYVGDDTMGLAVYDGKKVVYMQNLSVGALKLLEAFESLQRQTEEYHFLQEEYLDTIFDHIHLSQFPIKNLVFAGTQIDLVTTLCSDVDEADRISAKKLSVLCDELRALPLEAIALRYHLPEDKAALLYSSLSIYKKLLSFCKKSSSVISSAVDIPQAMADHLLSPKGPQEYQALLVESSVACSESIAQLFDCDLAHAAQIDRFSCKMFDKLKKIHGLPASKVLILRLAALLHSCGGYVSIRQHNKCTYDIVKGLDIYGLSPLEIAEVAFVAGNAEGNASLENNPDFRALQDPEKIVVSKLSAIFELANALDKSHKQKFSDVQISLDEDHVLFKTSSSENTLLEFWAFEEYASYFKSVFGRSPELIIRLNITI